MTDGWCFGMTKRQSVRFVIQSVAKDLGSTNVDEYEILPPFGRLNDKMIRQCE